MKANNSLTARKKQEITFSAFITSKGIQNRINSMMADPREGAQFVTAIVSAVTNNPALQACSHMSLLNCALLGHSLKLSPSPQLGQYFMVPFHDSHENSDIAQFILGYKGYLQLAIRSGYYRKLNVLPIKQGELLRYDPLEETIEVRLMEEEAAREEAETIGYFAMFEYHNGFRKTLYWTKEKMLAHADRYSPAFHRHGVESDNPKYSKVSFAAYEAGDYPPEDAKKYSSFWYRDFDGMACKTMLRQLISKWGVMSVDLQKAMETDGKAAREDGAFQAADEAAVLEQAQPNPVRQSAPDGQPAAGETSETDPVQNFFED